MLQSTEVGDYLREVRRRHRLSQRELARRAGVAASTVGRLEAGADTGGTPP